MHKEAAAASAPQMTGGWACLALLPAIHHPVASIACEFRRRRSAAAPALLWDAWKPRLLPSERILVSVEAQRRGRRRGDHRPPQRAVVRRRARESALFQAAPPDLLLVERTADVPDWAMAREELLHHLEIFLGQGALPSAAGGGRRSMVRVQPPLMSCVWPKQAGLGILQAGQGTVRVHRKGSDGRSERSRGPRRGGVRAFFPTAYSSEKTGCPLGWT